MQGVESGERERGRLERALGAEQARALESASLELAIESGALHEVGGDVGAYLERLWAELESAQLAAELAERRRAERLLEQVVESAKRARLALVGCGSAAQNQALRELEQALEQAESAQWERACIREHREHGERLAGAELERRALERQAGGELERRAREQVESANAALERELLERLESGAPGAR